MHKGIATASLITLVALAGCKKHEAANADTGAQTPAPAATPAPTPAATPPADAQPSTPTSEAQGKLDFATMEDGYMNDPDAQWATSAKASSQFGDADKLPPDSHDSSTAWQATGSVNGNGWTNNRQDIGFDWIQLDYDRPVSATAVRAVFDETAVAAINKVELIGVDGAAHTVWSGISDTKPETRGQRTWFVRKFDATPYPVKSVKLTFANNVARGYKAVDAVQLVGK
ncbi:hypothetical protein [Cognatilysobacter lacus]|uniref:Discoidin domain-containing protein n=1 Tax=Cognatilysobacter lacus TaxID=1643323 RepID=A0A5D8YMI5_9GAMM|nr:hypothetical protein [Lysobacter lacus]TZF83507.1 hypothetical protein FW784_12920 [Lysobacter lacus]